MANIHGFNGMNREDNNNQNNRQGGYGGSIILRYITL